MSSFRLHRRALLRGAGGAIAVALPPLEAMFDGRGRLHGQAHAAGPPVRVLTFFWPNGAHMEEFTPKTTGAGYTLPQCLTPFADVKSHLLVLTGVKNQGSLEGQGDSHEKGRVCFSTAVPCPSGQSAGGPSIDQVVAQKIGNMTKFPSLVFASGAAQGGNSQYFSWAAAGRPVQPETKPSRIFDKLFAGTVATPNVDLTAIRKKRQSVLDFVKGDIGRLERKVGSSDKQRIAAHLDAVRELERRIALESSPGGTTCQTPTKPPQDPAEDPWQWTYGGAPVSRFELIVDLTVAALRCDLTRSVNLTLNNVDINSWIKATYGDTRAHHDISHDNAATAIHLGYTRWQVAYMASLMKKLAAVPEGAGNLLDNVVIFGSSEISHGGAHNYTNMPVLIGGGGGGKLRTGQHVNFMKFLEPGRFTNVNNNDWVDQGRVFLSILRAAGIQDVTTWGAATSPVSEILA